ncbi:hypothetical protein [Microbulbifer sp. TRSA005]|uniref:hypothetical protein n=1 Tax=unclassified Microbulbifer TaxID=2619833 RepID=UPI00403A0119
MPFFIKYLGKLVIIFFLAILGVVVGNFVGPDAAISPFLPTSADRQFMEYTGILTNFSLGFFTAVFSFLGCILLNLLLRQGFAVSLGVWFTYNVILHLRMHALPEIDAPFIFAFLVGQLAVLGVLKLLEGSCGNIGDGYIDRLRF